MVVPLLAIGVERWALHRLQMTETNLDLHNLEMQPDSCVSEVLRRSFASTHDWACALYLT
jgi:hypothetical protein